MLVTISLRQAGPKKSLILFLIASIGLSGCSNMSDQDRTKAQGAGAGAVVGGLLGAGAGALLGAASGRGTDAIIAGAIGGGVAGAALGGVGGYMYGMKVAEKKAKYASSEDFYLAEINDIQASTATIRKTNQSLSKSVAALESKKRSLDAALASGQLNRRNYNLQYDGLRKEVKIARSQAKPVEELVGYQRAVLQDVEATGASSSTTTRLTAAAKEQEAAFAPYEAMMDQLTKIEKPSRS
jgi:hypothetical protein